MDNFKLFFVKLNQKISRILSFTYYINYEQIIYFLQNKIHALKIAIYCRMSVFYKKIPPTDKVERDFYIKIIYEQPIHCLK